MSRTGGKLPENRILFVKNCSFKTTGADLYDLFGKYGSIRQIRMGNGAKTKGTAFVVFEEPLDVRSVILRRCAAAHVVASQAKTAFEHLNGFHLQERYLVGQSTSTTPRPLIPLTPFLAVLYHQAAKQALKVDIAKREAEVAEQKKRYNIAEAE